jgi:ATP-dependent protease HslVU (ClpYQ) peptidase subunit
MSLILAIKTKHALIFASDGMALEEKKGGEVLKLQTFSKVKIFGAQKIILAYAGSSRLFFTLKRALPYLSSEDEFLEDISRQYHGLKKGGQQLLMLVGRVAASNQKQIYFFDGKAGYRQVAHYILLGSGAYKIRNRVKREYRPTWEVREACSHVIDWIDSASVTPTVNYLPMIAVLTKDRAVDFSSQTKRFFRKMKQKMKKELIREITSRYPI